MAIGAVFGALNTMYSAVAARTREIGTLRALGFGGGAVVVSVLLESLVLAVAGGVIGGALAYLAFNNFHTSTMNFQSFSQITFAFRVTPQLLARGIVWAAVIGLIGGSVSGDSGRPPADCLRAARTVSVAGNEKGEWKIHSPLAILNLISTDNDRLCKAPPPARRCNRPVFS